MGNSQAKAVLFVGNPLEVIHELELITIIKLVLLISE